MYSQVRKNRITVNDSVIKSQAVALQSRGEAHLYVAKADGILSRKERAVIGRYAAGAQKLYDVLDINSDIAARVRHDIREIIADPAFSAWKTDDHYGEAVTLLRKARDHGNWSVSLTHLKHEHGLLQVALLDEYVFAESAAVKEILRKLEDEFSGER